MARSKSNGIDRARQALIRQLARDHKSFLRARQAAKKQADKLKQKDAVAKWRALQRYGYLRTKVNPAIKHLTPSRIKAINKAFKTANKQGAMNGPQVVRPLERKVKTVYTTYKTKTGERTVARQSIKYQLANQFKFVRTKNKPSTMQGIVHTPKGYMVSVKSNVSKVRIKKSGTIQEVENFKSGSITIDREGISGKDLLRLMEQIKSGKFKLPKYKGLRLEQWGTGNGRIYAYDRLEALVEKFERYISSYSESRLAAYLKATEIQLVDERNIRMTYNGQ